MPSTDFDTLIVGQGLAGSALAWQLISAGERVCVIDDGHRSSSSMVAAGLINPLAGMRFNRRPEVDDWLNASEAWYRTLQAEFGESIYHPIAMLRLFRSAEQQRFYERRRDDPASRTLLGERFDGTTCPEDIAAPHGGFIQHRTGYVDLPALLGQIRTWLARQDALLTEGFDHSALNVGPSRVMLGRLHARRLVFCEGARAVDNPWFDWLPLRPDKGEILNLSGNAWTPRHIVNGAHWLVPLHNGELRLGATHAHTRLDLDNTRAAHDELLAGFRGLRPQQTTPQVLRQQAGIRPATTDRYPLIGVHPAHPSLWVFNGFGARGALSIPWYAQRMARRLVHNEALPGEADIRRLA